MFGISFNKNRDLKYFNKDSKNKLLRTYLLNYQNLIIWKGKTQPSRLLIEMGHLEKELALLSCVDYERYRWFG